ncbi:MAG: RraA family protein [Thermoplasmatales archaeon]
MSRILQAVIGLGSSDASDALLSLGVMGVLEDVHFFVGSDKIVGLARTVVVAPMKNGNLSMKEGFLKACTNSREDTVLVIVSENKNYSSFGGLTSFIVRSCGIKGVVVCGSFRDFREIEENGVSVFATGVSPLIPPRGQSVISIGETVKYQGVTINNGDIVIGDRDGVTIVPFNLLEEVVNIAKKKRKNEEISKIELENLLQFKSKEWKNKRLK